MNGIVHTCQLYLHFSKLELEYIEKTFSDQIILQADNKFTIVVDNIKFTFLKTWHYTFLQVDFITLLNKPIITEADLNEINTKIINSIKYFTVNYDKEITLTRIDYRYDAYVPDKNTRDLLFKLYKKITSKKVTLNKEIYERSNSLKYKSEAKKQSVTLNVYDKSRWSYETQNPIFPYEEDVIRFEVQVLNSHLNYKKQKNFDKDLETYLTTAMFIKYFNDYVFPIFYTGNYYNIYHASKIIRKTFKDGCKSKKLEAFLIDVSNSGISKVQNKLGRKVFRDRINELTSLNINPILIPKQDKIANIENPLFKLKDSFQKLRHAKIFF